MYILSQLSRRCGSTVVDRKQQSKVDGLRDGKGSAKPTIYCDESEIIKNSFKICLFNYNTTCAFDNLKDTRHLFKDMFGHNLSHL